MSFRSCMRKLPVTKGQSMVSQASSAKEIFIFDFSFNLAFNLISVPSWTFVYIALKLSHFLLGSLLQRQNLLKFTALSNPASIVGTGQVWHKRYRLWHSTGRVVYLTWECRRPTPAQPDSRQLPAHYLYSFRQLLILLYSKPILILHNLWTLTSI